MKDLPGFVAAIIIVVFAGAVGGMVVGIILKTFL